jgi:hypothetical protein
VRFKGDSIAAVSKAEKKKLDTSGPAGWRNWRAAKASKALNGGFEYTLYTDALVTEDALTVPYRWIDTLAGDSHRSTGYASPAIVLRADIHLSDAEFAKLDIDWEKTDTKDYLAGDIGDELASLGALALRRRLRSGGITRRFEPSKSLGEPMLGWHQQPRLVSPPPKRRSIVEGITEGVKLSDLVPLVERYPLLGKNDARALARAARLYGHALWIADDDPAQAWLRLVSAIEVAADQAKTAKGMNPRDRIAQADPELAALLEETPDELGDRLAEHLAPTIKATNKFLEFLNAQLPGPPPQRPDFGELDWTWEGLEPGLRTIYGHRSLELHAGIAFPGPLCTVPVIDERGVPTEKIHSFGVAGQGAVWKEEDLPMHLHTFAYIVGEALCKWWSSLKAQ